MTVAVAAAVTTATFAVPLGTIFRRERVPIAPLRTAPCDDVNLGGDDGIPAPDVDAGYPTPTTIDRTGAGDSGPGLFTKPPVGSYPAYLDKPEFCASAIAANKSCGTIAYKSGTRAYVESLGYDIVASFGDQPSDLAGGYADRTFKMPNPNYYLP